MKLAVYLVEDSEIMSTLLRELLEGNGATIVGHAESAQTAIRDIGLVKPDVVIIDVALAHGNGFDVLRSLRDHPPPKRPLRIMLTNYSIASYRTAAMRLGADHFLDKSSQIPELLRVLRSMHRRSKDGNGTSS